MSCVVVRHGREAVIRMSLLRLFVFGAVFACGCLAVCVAVAAVIEDLIVINI